MERLNVEQAINQERQETLEHADALAYALALKNVRPEARFERTLTALLHKGRADAQPHAGWVVDERKYLAGYAPDELWRREVLMLGEDGKLRTVYEEPRGQYVDQRQRRVFHGTWLEGYNLRVRGGGQPMPVRAIREHDLEASRGDYFLGHVKIQGQSTPTIRREQDPSVASELSVQRALGDLAIRHRVDDFMGVSISE